MCHAAISQATGRKRVYLYAPDQWINLYPYTADITTPRASRVDIPQWRRGDATQRHRFPRVANARCYTTVLEAGDLLYMPAFWWHAVEALDANISVLTPFDLNSDEQRVDRPWTRPDWGLDQGIIDPITS